MKIVKHNTYKCVAMQVSASYMKKLLWPHAIRVGKPSASKDVGIKEKAPLAAVASTRRGGLIGGGEAAGK